MDETTVLYIAIAASIGGGALAAHLARTAAWRGAVLTLIASIVQILFDTFAPVGNSIVSSLVFLAAVGLVGGRWGMGLSARQMSVIVVGSFLFSLAGALAVLYLVPLAPEA